MKLQTVSLAAKLGVLAAPSALYHTPILQLVKHLLAMAKQDRNINIRDRTRFLEALLVGAGVVEVPKRSERTSWDGPNAGITDIGGVKLRREQVRVVLLEGVRSVPLQNEGLYFKLIWYLVVNLVFRRSAVPCSYFWLS